MRVEDNTGIYKGRTIAFSPQEADALRLVGYTIIEHPHQVRTLLERHGISAHASDKQMAAAIADRIGANDQAFIQDLTHTVVSCQRTYDKQDGEGEAPSGFLATVGSIFGGIGGAIGGIIGSIFGGKDKKLTQAQINAQITSQILAIQQEKERAARQKNLIIAGLVAAFALTTVLIIFYTVRKRKAKAA